MLQILSSQRTKAAPWVQSYKWSILCFIAVGFWNVVGAGLLGFSINTPIALYYVQGLNMTAAHGHAALFGVYGMLGIGLLLFCLRGLSHRAAWSDRLLQAMSWSLNIGLAMMVFISLLPAGTCRVPCDHLPRRSWALFQAREVMRGVLESLTAKQPT